MDIHKIIDNYYGESSSQLKTILLTHSRAVATKALAICDRHPELHLDRQFVFEAAMLHDIGIIGCHAPGICCHGTEPYIRHGIIGAAMLRHEHLPRHARVCERHTGAGISPQDIISQQLPLPLADYRPETLEEQLICYADKFFSKTHTTREKTPEEAIGSLQKFGAEGVKRFSHWAEIFAI